MNSLPNVIHIRPNVIEREREMLLKRWYRRCGVTSGSGRRRHHQSSCRVLVAGVEIPAVGRISQTWTGKGRDVASRGAGSPGSRNQTPILRAKHTVDLPSAQRVPLQGWLAGQGRELINPDQVPNQVGIGVLVTERRTQGVLRVEIDVLV